MNVHVGIKEGGMQGRRKSDALRERGMKEGMNEARK